MKNRKPLLLVLLGITVLFSGVRVSLGEEREGQQSSIIVSSNSELVSDTPYVKIIRTRSLDLPTRRSEDIDSLVDLANDLAGEIDWSKEPSFWAVNHQVEERLPRSCDEYPKLLSLLKTRQKLFFIYHKLTTSDPRWKDLNWYKNRSYYNLFFNRGTDFINNFFEENREYIEKFINIENEHLDDWKLFIDELLNYYARVVSTNEWENKFQRLLSLERISLSVGQHYNEIGFPMNKNECYMRGWNFGGNYVVGYDNGTEGWFYGFWLRRHLEGNMELVRSILEWALRFLAGPEKVDGTQSMDRRKEAQSQFVIVQSAPGQISGDFEQAKALAAVDTLQAMRICESVLDNSTNRDSVERCHLLLGRLKQEYQKHVTPLYANGYRREFRYNEIGGNYIYNGFHFKELIKKFPNSQMRDDAAYGLTKLSQGGECEGSVDCYIERQFSSVKQFLTEYPDSDFALEAVDRANSAFTSNLMRLDDLTTPTRRYDPERVKVTLREYDNIASTLPTPLRLKAQKVIANLSFRLLDYDRATKLYQSALQEVTDKTERDQIQKRLAAIPKIRFEVKPGVVVSYDRIDLEWIPPKTEIIKEYRIHRSPGFLSPFQEYVSITPSYTRFIDTDITPATEYRYRVEAVSESTSGLSNEVICSSDPKTLTPIGMIYSQEDRKVYVFGYLESGTPEVLEISEQGKVLGRIRATFFGLEEYATQHARDAYADEIWFADSAKQKIIRFERDDPRVKAGLRDVIISGNDFEFLDLRSLPYYGFILSISENSEKMWVEERSSGMGPYSLLWNDQSDRVLMGHAGRITIGKSGKVIFVTTPGRGMAEYPMRTFMSENPSSAWFYLSSHKSLIKVNVKGDVEAEVSLAGVANTLRQSYVPIAIDDGRDSIWVVNKISGSGRGLTKFTTNGTRIFNLTFERIVGEKEHWRRYFLAPSPADGGLWFLFHGRLTSYLVKLDENGTVLSRSIL